MAAISQSGTFYVDANSGSDNSDGSLVSPFKTVSKALEVVSARVDGGVSSDIIYLRGGIYRNDGFTTDPNDRDFTLYNLNLKGTSGVPAMIAAMPCAAGTPGCVQRKSGQWYERVILDDGYTIPAGIWTPFDGNIWQAQPGYVNSKWGSNGKGIGWLAGANSDYFALGPRMILQDGEPLLWADPWPNYHPLTDPFDPNPVVDPAAVLTQPGMRTFDQNTGTLFVWPIDNLDPNSVRMESWKGTTPDIRSRHMFKGSMEHVEIKGIVFRLVTSLLRSGSLKSGNNHITWEDNIFSYCWKHIFQDGDQLKIGALQRLDWQVRYNVFYRPSREVFQIWGDDHIFEFNEIIEHGGPWAGGAAMVSAVNARHMNNVQIRFNYIRGQGNNRWHAGSVFMIEADTEQQDANGDCLYGGQTYEYNFFGDMDAGTAIYLGRGGCRLQNITIKNNVFTINRGVGGRFNGGEAIRVTSPHTNLQIRNNVFFDQKNIIKVRNDRGGVNLEDMPSTISIRRNIFMNNVCSGSVIDARLVAVAAVDSNLFFNNSGASVGSNIITGDPLFTDPSVFNFTLLAGSPAIQTGPDLGAYEFGVPIPAGTEWWIIKEEIFFPSPLPTSVETIDNGAVPERFVLFQNFPNPFNPSTTIRFYLSRGEHVTLTVFDILGREVAVLLDGELSSGEHSVVFDAKKLSSGVYLYRIAAGPFTQIHKALLMK